MKKLIILTGPTAVGKTDLSIELAKALNGEIISADSIQVYKKMDIGSAKIKKEEMQGIKHYLIDEMNPDEEFNVYIFQQKTLEYMNEIYKKGKIPIIVGGTGFYIQSVLYDINFDEAEDGHEYRRELETLARDKGNIYVHNLLKECDPVSAEKIHYNNIKRVIRALEFFKENGYPISKHNKIQNQNISPYNFVYFVLNDDRSTLYERINKRVDIMFENGLVDEVKTLLLEGYGRELTSMQGIGYKEVISYLNDEITLPEAKELIKKNTRHFAKRQLTWFRREKEVSMINYNDFDYDKSNILEYMLKLLKSKNIYEE